VQIRAVKGTDHHRQSSIAWWLLKGNTEAHGTVEALAVAHEEAVSDGKSLTHLGAYVRSLIILASSKVKLIRSPISKNMEWISDRCHHTLAEYYNGLDIQTSPPRTYLALDPAAPRHANYLVCHAIFYNYVVQNGRRIAASHRMDESTSRSLHSALVKVLVGADFRYGKVIQLFEHEQTGHQPVVFAEMRWFETLDAVPIEVDVWNAL
jgi:hypothetical protein